MATFELAPDALHQVFESKSLEQLKGLGGIRGLQDKLHTNLETGLSTKSKDSAAVSVEKTGHVSTGTETIFEERRRIYGTNALPPVKSVTFLQFCLEALKDKILILLMVCAVVEIGIGLWKATSKSDTIAIIDGCAILIAVIIVVLVSALNDYKKQKQFRNLSEFSKSLAQTTVIRDGVNCQIPNTHVLVGDVVIVNTGDVLCCDGIFISGYNVKCDESALTGESDALSKDQNKDPFLISGTKVINGLGQMLVVGTGIYSVNGRLMRTLDIETEETPLQKKLSTLADQIAKFGISAALAMIVILLVTYFAVSNDRSQDSIASDVIEVLISAVTLIVVAVPEGLPLAVTLALAHATNRMLKDNNLVRHLSACETMGNATTICSDKTGTLTQNKMTVVRGSVSEKDFALDGISPALITELQKTAPGNHIKALVELLSQAINMNSTASETENQKGEVEFVGSKTEIALLEFTAKLNLKYSEMRRSLKTVQVLPFSSDRKRMSTVIESAFPSELKLATLLPPGVQPSQYVLFCKGASEIVLGLSRYFVNAEGKAVTLDDRIRSDIEAKITAYAENALRTIAVGFKPMPHTYYPKQGETEGSKSSLEDDTSEETNLIFLGLFGIQDPVRPEVPEAVKQCQRAGVVVRMVTGDNLVTAKSIATQCGILTEDGLVMEGPVFRRLTPDMMDSTVPHLQVLARSSPLDKQLLVKSLKRIGETVAVTGDGTNDAPALRSADVGFSMGIAGTEVAKEASDIVLMDDNFASLVKAVIWGRSVYDSVRKFLQFQLTVNVTAVVITILTSLISTVTSPAKVPDAALTAVQLLWVNLIMDTFAALALATDPPTPELLNRMPSKRTDSLISQPMWKQILGQAAYQILVCFLVYLRAEAIFGADIVASHPLERVGGLSRFNSTVVFNVFVFCQIFNEFNSRSITKDLNIFRGILKNNYFLSIFVLTVAAQVIIIQFGGVVFKVTDGLDWRSWLICVALGMGSIPVGLLIRLVPDIVRKPETAEEVRQEIQEVQIEVEDLVGSVLDTVEQTVVKPMNSSERNLWKRAIRNTVLQLRATGSFRGASREMFTEGARIGAQVAMGLVKEKSIEPDALPAGLPLEQNLTRGQELWFKAATTVRREISVVHAFRRYRRGSPYVSRNNTVSRPNSLVGGKF